MTLLIELPAADQCCGFGGTFALKNAETSTAMLADKMGNVLDTGAEVVHAPGDSSCLMHIGGGLSRLRSGIRTVHLAEILASTDHDMTFLGSPPRAASGTCAATEDVPGRGPEVARRHPAARQPRPRHPHDPQQARVAVVAEVDDWEELRCAGSALKAATMARLDEHLEQLERKVTARGGIVHWARDANEANPIVTRPRPGHRRPTRSSRSSRWPRRRSGSTRRSRQRASRRIETDLAELIVQLGEDKPSHILVPAIHRNRAEIREIFLRAMPGVDPEITDDPRRLADGRARPPARAVPAREGRDQRRQLRGRRHRHAAVVESEGNGRMCLTLPDTLITVMGIEKVVPTWQRPRGVPAAAAALVHRRADEPVHVGLDGSDARRRAAGRSTSCCSTTAAPQRSPTRWAAARCTASAARPASTSAPSTSAPAGTRTARCTPARSAPSSPRSSRAVEDNASLPYASTLCGACFDACPVRIDIPSLLVHLRAGTWTSSGSGVCPRRRPSR